MRNLRYLYNDFETYKLNPDIKAWSGMMTSNMTSRGDLSRFITLLVTSVVANLAFMLELTCRYVILGA